MSVNGNKRLELGMVQRIWLGLTARAVQQFNCASASDRELVR